MELKYGREALAAGFTVSSNRTFMELKYIKQLSKNLTWCVLIAPLWN